MAEVEQSAGGTDAGNPASAPYMSFQGFINLLNKLKEDGVPSVFDGSFFGALSGSLVAQTRGTLRFLDLMDEGKHPTPSLEPLANADEAGRKQLLRPLAEAKYADVLTLSPNATQGQLADVFRGRGLSGQTIPKAIAFYTGLAEYVGLPMSPYFKKGRPVSSGGSGVGAARRTARRRRAPDAASVAPKVDQPTVPPIEVKKSAYIDLLMKLVQDQPGSEDQKDLLDRLERALGYELPHPVAKEP
jgi:hypothetical protein